MADLIEKSPILSMLTMCINQCECDWDDGYNTGIAEAMQYVKNAPAVNRWISVEDDLPEEDVSVICYMRIGEIVVMEYGGDGWYCGVTRYNPRAVTHWMYLPEPPEKE